MIITDCNKYSNEIYLLEKQTFSDFWSHKTICDTMLNDRYFWAVCVVENILVGYICASTVVDEATIERIAVGESFRGCGIATKLMECFLQNVDFNKAFLEVRSKNEPAIKLYENFNFAKIDIRKNYYKNPTDNAIIMMLGR